MRYYVLAFGGEESSVQEFLTKTLQDEAAERTFNEMCELYDVVNVLSLDVDEKGKLTITRSRLDYDC